MGIYDLIWYSLSREHSDYSWSSQPVNVTNRERITLLDADVGSCNFAEIYAALRFNVALFLLCSKEVMVARACDAQSCKSQYTLTCCLCFFSLIPCPVYKSVAEVCQWKMLQQHLHLLLFLHLHLHLLHWLAQSPARRSFTRL